jgi:D-psicose/D-tagatose/L-ribulose 3-epimerase
MKIGANTFIWSASCDQTVENVLPVLKKKGFDGVEVPLFRATDFPASRFRKAIETNGLECNVCTVLVDGLSLISEDAGLRQKTLVHLKDLVQTAADVNARIMAGLSQTYWETLAFNSALPVWTAHPPLPSGAACANLANP